MHYEVEVKYPIENFEALRKIILERGARYKKTIEQEDLYFAHPLRDFSETDEAFRIRRVGSKNMVTYKGPLVDQETKTRQEIEVQLADGPETLAGFEEVLKQLSFQPVHRVCKSRNIFILNEAEREFEIVLDHVRELGDYAEIESQAEESQVDEVREQILELAKSLSLGPQVERRSYLRLLLDKKNANT
ncbi:CYTH domain protein [Rubinisphaera italica]|uniref:CYTH domain protein n=2 Tax=Rubinisphaera italica TaxID=2527969 RepID=A0A5C5XB72_9PLAN|nr:CYTH domain protein [Rubinisphaera italica]